MASGQELLDKAIKAHGGLNRWRSIKEIVTHIRCGGMALPLRFKFRTFKSYEAQISTTKPRIIFSPFTGKGKRGIFLGDTVRIETDNGQVLAERTNAKAAFNNFRHKFYWDNLDALYFGGYAIWNYFSAPFLFLHKGFEIQEMILGRKTIIPGDASRSFSLLTSRPIRVNRSSISILEMLLKKGFSETLLQKS